MLATDIRPGQIERVMAHQQHNNRMIVNVKNELDELGMDEVDYGSAYYYLEKDRKRHGAGLRKGQVVVGQDNQSQLQNKIGQRVESKIDREAREHVIDKLEMKIMELRKKIDKKLAKIDKPVTFEDLLKKKKKGKKNSKITQSMKILRLKVRVGLIRRLLLGVLASNPQAVHLGKMKHSQLSHIEADVRQKAREFMFRDGVGKLQTLKAKLDQEAAERAQKQPTDGQKVSLLPELSRNSILNNRYKSLDDQRKHSSILVEEFAPHQQPNESEERAQILSEDQYYSLGQKSSMPKIRLKKIDQKELFVFKRALQGDTQSLAISPFNQLSLLKQNQIPQNIPQSISQQPINTLSQPTKVKRIMIDNSIMLVRPEMDASEKQIFTMNQFRTNEERMLLAMQYDGGERMTDGVFRPKMLGDFSRSDCAAQIFVDEEYSMDKRRDFNLSYLLKKRNKQSSTLSHSKERLPAIQELPHKESIIIKPKTNQRKQLTETQQAIPVQRQESQEEKSFGESDVKGLIEVPFILKNSMGQIMDVNQNALDPYYITNIQQEMIEPRRKNQEVIRKVLREKLELDRKRVQLIQSLQSSVDSLGTIQDDQPIVKQRTGELFKAFVESSKFIKLRK
ncbi:hypothetical protein FGO68_gene15773 [Halteria grandinella]|uniref:Uncharacterized protein n=1 Tax=Halteria grandinella TaxID=5974 RepID=A0A8J8NXZ7_HALGN|nr:hypothetical protein FGO68_gene15773 [Halteria grandinella]